MASKLVEYTEADYKVVTLKEWLSFMRGEWYQGEHIAFLGPTGTGKTTLARALVQLRTYVVAIATKRNDDTLESFKKERFTIIKKWPPHQWEKRVILWIKPTSLGKKDILSQREIISEALSDIYLAGGWCVFLDEAGYLSTTLGQGMSIGMLMSQARSAGLSIVCGVQRPHSIAGQIPLEILNQAKHHIFFKYEDRREIKSCAEIAGISYEFMIYLMSQLAIHEMRNTDFLYVGNGHIMLVKV